jgi:hypothetical protein
MSGMFERIARRQADRPDEPTADDAQATTDLPADDRPTERIEAVDLTTRIPAVETTSAQPASDAPAPAAPPSAAPSAPALPAATQPPAPAQGDTVVAEPAPRRPGFRARGRMRRRLRYLRKLRELQVRDLGGLVFDLRRFERKRDDLVARKIDQIRACDDELRALERALDERRDLRDVREPGIGGTCPRCFAIYGSADKFCASCGAAFGGAVQGPAAQIPLSPPITMPQPPSEPEASGAGGPGSEA